MSRLFEALLEADAEIFEAILADIERQNLYLNLIASENYTKPSSLGCFGEPDAKQVC